MEMSTPIPQLVESFRKQKADYSCNSLAGGDSSNNREINRSVQTNQEDKMGCHSDSELFTDNYCRVCCAMLISEVQRTTHYESKKHANKVRSYFQLHKEEGTPSKKIKTGNAAVGFQDAGTGEVDKNKFCILCNMVFTSPVVAESHYKGKIHAKRLKQLVGEQPCVTQPQTVTTNVANPPTEERSVQSEQLEKGKQDVAQEAATAASAALDLEDPNRLCKLCNASFNNPIMAQQHYNGKKHKKNDLRRQLMEEMGKETDSPEKNVGAGDYPCAICNVTLNSIEQYQCHLQGYKHHLKENKVVNLVKNTKSKIYDSFQDELDDFIKVQKARGLVPKVSFRKFEDHQEEEDTVNLLSASPPHSPAYPLEGFPTAKPSDLPDERTFPNYVEIGAELLPTLQNDHLKDKCEQNSNLHIEYHTQMPLSVMPTHPENSQGPFSLESFDECKPITSDDSLDSCKKDKIRGKKKHRRDKRNKEIETKRESELPSYRVEESPKGLCLEQVKDQSKQKAEQRDRDEFILNKEKVKLKKEKRELNQEKEEVKLKHKKQKKKKEVDTRTEEEKLWDESILGI
ncbi:zinc finger matrin-type protein 1-like isoform X3 [Stegostoma tigrinum]|uniref:zinc finger matrin-type protein 1-like isoform X3 n=1 Tax=Stegostoma tigrinum TaxID=3053191 RepID=UPI00202AF859|nr:zinc finger matrin-type protein 1-like isoform X3 [Stegostoma tigrinum]